MTIREQLINSLCESEPGLAERTLICLAHIIMGKANEVFTANNLSADDIDNKMQMLLTTDFDEMSKEDEDTYFLIFDQLENLLDAPEVDLSTRESTLLDLQYRWTRAAS